MIGRKSVYVNPQYVQLTSFIEQLPQLFDQGGTVLYQGRNVLKRFCIDGVSVVVKSYKIPIWFNRIVYRFFRLPKAVRSYDYAELLRSIGVGSPAPVGYHIEENGLLMGRSYFVSQESECPFTYRDIQNYSGNLNELLRAIARMTARLHDNGILHKDYSAGNILYGETLEGVVLEVIDLNRIRFGKVDMQTGCENFSRLPGSVEMLDVLADEYAHCRGFNTNECRRIIHETHGADNRYIR